MAEHSLTIQGIRSTDNFLKSEPSVMVVSPLVDWHLGEGDFAGLEFGIDTPLWKYRFSISMGGLETLIDMQKSAQTETNQQITRERGHK